MPTLSLTELASIQPNPKAWPQCPTCKAPYVLRRGMMFEIAKKSAAFEGMQWGWQRDCLHRTPPVVATAKSDEAPKRAKKGRR